MQPLTKEARDLFRNIRNDLQQANKGLLFDRFYNGYEADFSTTQGNDAAELQLFVGSCGEQNQLADAAARRVKLAGSLGGQFGVFKTDWHFVSGMGNAHPVENGFTWHPVYGAPYLPGSSVKGLLRAWMEVWASADQSAEERQALIDDWFGRDAVKGDSGKAGELIFFDALPIERPKISVDIMTPHMGKWYEQGGEKITPESQPGDWHDPRPVPFLVASDARFVFVIAPRTPAAKDSELARQAMEHLKHALAWLGAGAKTAAGYGHMSFDADDTLLRFAPEEERKAIREARSAEKQKERLAESGIAVGSETWQGALVTATNPGAGELTVEHTHENGTKELASGAFYSQLDKKAKDKLKKKKNVRVDVDIERQGNQVIILALRENSNES